MLGRHARFSILIPIVIRVSISVLGLHLGVKLHDPDKYCCMLRRLCAPWVVEDAYQLQSVPAHRHSAAPGAVIPAVEAALGAAILVVEAAPALLHIGTSTSASR